MRAPVVNRTARSGIQPVQLKYDGSGRPVWLGGKKKVSDVAGIAFTGDYEAPVSFGFEH